MPLSHLTVLELAGLAPAPHCGLVFSDFGAKVIRVDKPNQSSSSDVLSRGKRSICLDLKDKRVIAMILDKIIPKIDILLDPYRPGVLESLGLGPKECMAKNKGLIYARITGYGQTGPFKDMAGHDINYISVAGVLGAFGRHGAKPTIPGNIIGDFGGGGVSAVVGILIALIERHKSGLGQVVDVSMVEGAAYLS